MRPPAQAEAVHRPEQQSLFRRDDGMIRLAGSKGQDRVDVSVLEIRIFLKDRLSRLPADSKPRISETVMRRPRMHGRPCMRSASIVILFSRSGIGNAIC
jgi:hypothetical protein